MKLIEQILYLRQDLCSDRTCVLIRIVASSSSLRDAQSPGALEMKPAEMHTWRQGCLAAASTFHERPWPCDWTGSLESGVSSARVAEHVIRSGRLAQPFQGLRICSRPVPPFEDITRDDLDHMRVVIAEPVVNEVAYFQADCMQQLTRDRHLSNLGDLMRAVRHGHVHDFIKFNNLWPWPCRL
jgi:hypothetical protein